MPLPLVRPPHRLSIAPVSRACLAALILLVRGPALFAADQVPFTWNVQLPSAWSLASGHPASIQVVIGSTATDVKLAACSFVEQSTKTPLGCDRLHLCEKASGDCPAALTLAAGAHALFLRGDDNIEPGTYLGSIAIAAKEDAKGYTSPAITLYETTPARRIWGLVCMLLGVVGAWLLTSYGRTRIARDQALLPAAMLSSQLVDLQTTLAGAPSPYHDRTAHTAKAIRDLLDKLSQTNLDLANYLPPRFPNPFGGVPPDVAGYKAFLEGLNVPVAVVTAIVRDGLVRAWTHWKPEQPAVEIAVGTAVDAIDLLAAEPLLTLEQTQARIHASLVALDQALNPPAPGFVRQLAAAPAGAAAPLSFERLSLEVTRLEVSVWIVWLLVTCLAGSAALIFSDLGFGNPLDYVRCLLWGFGVPAAGQQLLQVTAGSVSQALGISILK